MHTFNLRALEAVAPLRELEASQGRTVTPRFHESSSRWLVSPLLNLGSRKDRLVSFWTSSHLTLLPQEKCVNCTRKFRCTQGFQLQVRPGSVQLWTYVL